MTALRGVKMDGFGEGDKPPKKKRGSQDRYAFHQCFHGDALLGVAMLDDGERGVYITIIWTMYQQRAALPLDYSWLARINNITVQRLRARLKSLADKGRIVIDEDNGLVVDERTMRELVAAERYNQAQAERAKARWKDKERAKPKAELRLVDPAELIEIVEQAGSAMQFQLPPQPPLQPPRHPPNNLGGCFALSEQNQEPGECPAHANHIHIHNNPLTPIASPKRASPGRRAALPRDRGGAPQSKDEFLKDQRKRLGLDGKDDDGAPDKPAPGDRKAKRA